MKLCQYIFLFVEKENWPEPQNIGDTKKAEGDDTTKAEEGKQKKEQEEEDDESSCKLLHPVAAIHVALRQKKARRRALFSTCGPFKRALSARRDLAIR